MGELLGLIDGETDGKLDYVGATDTVRDVVSPHCPNSLLVSSESKLQPVGVDTSSPLNTNV